MASRPHCAPFPVPPTCVLFAVFGRRHGVSPAAWFWRLPLTAAVSPADVGRRAAPLTSRVNRTLCTTILVVAVAVYVYQRHVPCYLYKHHLL